MENSDQPPAPRPRVDDLRMEVVMRRLFAPTRSAARFGRYVVLDKLGEGGMGVVFAAYDDRLDRRVALKVVRVDADASPRARQRVLREAKALARVSHPNVVQVHEVGEVEGEVFIAMEYLRGPTLAAWIAEDRTSSKPRPWRAVMAIFLPLARGLAAAHGRGLVHRDFKPANVLIDEDVERPVLLDFGLARAAAFEARTSGATADDERPTAPLSSVTATGAMVGTLGYMSPEQCRGDHVDARADQFSFCAALYEALYGALPFPTSTVIDYERAIATRALAASRAPRRVPRRIREALSRGLSARAEDRFESMGSLVAALEADPWRRALRLAQGLAALASLAAAIYFVYAWTRPGVVTADVNVERADRGRVRAWLDATPMIREDSEGTARFVGTAPAGPHTVMIEAEGYRPREQVVRVTRNGQHPIAVQLERERGPLDVDVEPRGSSILLDGHSLGANLRGYPVETGAHTMLVRSPGSHDRVRTFTNHADVGHHEFVALPPGEIWSLLQTGNMYPMFVMGDVDGDGLPEVLVHQFNDYAAFSPWTGALIWRLALSNALDSQPSKEVDVNRDGVMDVVVALRDVDGAALVAWSGRPDERAPGQPAELWRSPVAKPGESLVDPVVADLDGDGAVEVYTLGFDGDRLTAHNGATGAARWRSHDALEGVNLEWLSRDLSARPELREFGGQLLIRAARTIVAPAATDGAPRWRVDASAIPDVEAVHRAIDWFLITTTKGDARLAVAFGGDEREAVVAALRLEDGAVAWSTKLGELSRGEDPWCRPLPGADLFCQAHSTITEKSWLRRVDADTGELGPLHDTLGSTWALRLRGAAPELVLITTTPERVEHRDVKTGAVVHSWQTKHPSVTPPVAIDWNNDGRDDVIVGTADNSVEAFALDSGSIGALWTESILNEFDPVGDLDGDGFPEFLVKGSRGGLISVANALWERQTGEVIDATPIVMNLDDDDGLEVAAFVRFDDFLGLHILNAETGATEARAPVGTDDTLHRPVVVPTRDGGVDLITLTKNSGVRRYRGRDGWRANDDNTHHRSILGYGAPLVHDLDGDGSLEVVAAADTSDTDQSKSGLWRLRADDLSLLEEPTSAPPIASIRVADLNGDHTEEVLTLTLEGDLEIRDASLAFQQGFSLGGKVERRTPIHVEDLDDDGAPELVVQLAEPREVVVLGADLRERWRSGGPLAPNGIAVLSKSQGFDGALVVVNTRSSGVFAFDAEGAPRWRSEVTSWRATFGERRQPPIAADLTGDGAPELVVLSPEGALYVLDPRDGRTLARFRGSGFEPPAAAPVIADVDFDGAPEILIASSDRRLRMLLVPVGVRTHADDRSRP